MSYLLPYISSLTFDRKIFPNITLYDSSMTTYRQFFWNDTWNALRTRTHSPSRNYSGTKMKDPPWENTYKDIPGRRWTSFKKEHLIRDTRVNFDHYDVYRQDKNVWRRTTTSKPSNYQQILDFTVSKQQHQQSLHTRRLKKLLCWIVFTLSENTTTKVCQHKQS